MNFFPRQTKASRKLWKIHINTYLNNVFFLVRQAECLSKTRTKKREREKKNQILSIEKSNVSMRFRNPISKVRYIQSYTILIPRGVERAAAAAAAFIPILIPPPHPLSLFCCSFSQEKTMRAISKILHEHKQSLWAVYIRQDTSVWRNFFMHVYLPAIQEYIIFYARDNVIFEKRKKYYQFTVELEKPTDYLLIFFFFFSIVIPSTTLWLFSRIESGIFQSSTILTESQKLNSFLLHVLEWILCFHSSWFFPFSK